MTTMVIDDVSAAGAGGGGTYVESGALTYATNMNVSHTFASQPKAWGAYIVCTVAEAGYAVGEKVAIPTSYNYDGTSFHSSSVYVNDKTVRLRSFGYLWGTNGTSNGHAAFQPGKWDVKLWAIL